MVMNINGEQMGVLLQAAYDAGKSAEKKVIDYAVLKEELEKFNNNPIPGLFSIDFKMSSNGGSITIRHIKQIEEKKNERRYGEFDSDMYVLIEPKGYAKIEPYNRQPPFYVPRSYSNLKIMYAHGEYIIRRSYAEPCNTFTCVDEDIFNNFWGIYTHVVYVHENDIETVIAKIIEIAIGGEE